MIDCLLQIISGTVPRSVRILRAQDPVSKSPNYSPCATEHHLHSARVPVPFHRELVLQPRGHAPASPRPSACHPAPPRHRLSLILPSSPLPASWKHLAPQQQQAHAARMQHQVRCPRVLLSPTELRPLPSCWTRRALFGRNTPPLSHVRIGQNFIRQAAGLETWPD